VSRTRHIPFLRIQIYTMTFVGNGLALSTVFLWAYDQDAWA